jgi:hypothetical protein
MTQMTATDAHLIEAPHDADDEVKLEQLADAMRRDGWVGAPVVVIEREDADPLAVTGSHRIAAAREVGIDVPTVLLADLVAQRGGNLAEMIADFEAAGFDRDSATIEAAIRVVGQLPADVVEHYGLDMH